MRRRTSEIWLLVGIAVIPAILAGSWALSLWQSIDILAVVQFPWRLLGIMSPALALLVGGITSRIQTGYQICIVCIITLLIIIFAHMPRLGDINTYSPESVELSLANIAQIEHFKGAETGGEDTSSIQEFKPKWAGRSLVLEPSNDQDLSQFEIDLLQANAYNKEFIIRAKEDGTLRFNQFYFPGWKVTTDTSQDINVYPSTNLGLLTIDLEKGQHKLSVEWVGTRLQNIAALISIIAMVILSIIAWYALPKQWLSLIPLVILIIGVTGYTRQPKLEPVQQSQQEFSQSGVELLGYRYEQPNAEYLYLFPYWHVSTAQLSSLHTEWRLLDDKGNTVLHFRSHPYFNSYHANNWPPGSVVDDAYRLPIPASLVPGVYQLALQMGFGDKGLEAEPTIIGNISIEREPSPQLKAPNPTIARFGESIYLEGYGLKIGGTLSGSDSPITTAHAGTDLLYTLYWKADQPLLQNYHGFIHLVDQQGVPIAQRDQLTGPLFQPSMLWDSYRPKPDVYSLNVPDQTPSGLYWPTVGLYDFDSRSRLPVYIQNEPEAGDHVRLPPIKVVNPQLHEPMHPIGLEIGDFATLLGYDMDLPVDGIYRNGSTIQITLYYHSNALTSGDYVRFIHVYNNRSGVVAQNDSQPQKGANPTWAWIPGEVVRDVVDIHLPLDGLPGHYELLMGFYDPTSDYARLPLFTDNRHIQVSEDQVLTLTRIQTICGYSEC